MTLKERIKNGETVYGTMVRVQRNPAFCLLARDAGLDFIMFDCEHGTFICCRKPALFFQSQTS